jgi:hypothetical protein
MTPPSTKVARGSFSEAVDGQTFIRSRYLLIEPLHRIPSPLLRASRGVIVNMDDQVRIDAISGVGLLSALGANYARKRILDHKPTRWTSGHLSPPICLSFANE